MASRLDDRAARLIISLAGEPGDERVGASVAEFGAIASVEKWLSEKSTSTIAKSIKRVIDTCAVESALKAIDIVQGRFITPHDSEWPQSLDDLDVAGPVGLWVCGDSDLAALCKPAVAIVGARASTAYGERVASDIASHAAQENVTVVSGGAYGIDAAAHRGALAQIGSTVAVLACGVDVAYPAAHQGLLERIKSTGLVISEAPPGAGPHKHRFLTRNRLIAALSQSVVVVEAALRSGALSTSNWAGVLGRPTWGVPGLITSATSAGVHHGIWESGFRIVLDVADPIRELRIDAPRHDSPAELVIKNALLAGSRNLGEICAYLALNGDEPLADGVHGVLGTLNVMEVRNDIIRNGDRWELPH